MDPFQQAADLVRARDPDRYFADLFAPAAARPYLFALHAFNSEVARVREVVSEPLPGEMRLQWWRDVLASGEAAAIGHPVAAAVGNAIAAFRLPLAAFDNLLAARTFDLYDNPMPTMADFEGYAGETSSALFQLAAIILAGGADPGSGEAAGHAGVAYALTGLMRAFPLHSRRRQLFLPRDRLERHGVALTDLWAGRGGPTLTAAFADLRAEARRHLAEAQSAAAALPATVQAAFLPLALVEPYLRRLDRNRDPLAETADLPLWRRQWHLWRAARRIRS